MKTIEFKAHAKFANGVPIPEIVKWCEDTCDGEFFVRSGIAKKESDKFFSLIRVTFTEKIDAMKFKLSHEYGKFANSHLQELDIPDGQVIIVENGEPYMCLKNTWFEFGFDTSK